MSSRQQLQLEFAQRDISFQYAQLCLPTNCPTGIYVQLDDDDTHCKPHYHGPIFRTMHGGFLTFLVAYDPN